MAHISKVFRLSDASLRYQLTTKFRDRADNYTYASAIDLTGAILTGVDFSECNLNYARFHRTQFRDCSFENSFLSGVNFAHGELNACSFRDAKVTNVIVDGTRLIGKGESSSKRTLVENDYASFPTKEVRDWFVSQGAVDFGEFVADRPKRKRGRGRANK